MLLMLQLLILLFQTIKVAFESVLAQYIQMNLWCWEIIVVA
jgi:hypothetical protein